MGKTKSQDSMTSIDETMLPLRLQLFILKVARYSENVNLANSLGRFIDIGMCAAREKNSHRWSHRCQQPKEGPSMAGPRPGAKMGTPGDSLRGRVEATTRRSSSAPEARLPRPGQGSRRQPAVR